MSAKVKVTIGEVESVYRCTYPLARAIDVILHHSDSAEEVETQTRDDVYNLISKIRADISSHVGGCGLYNDGLDMAISIIDKHLKDFNA